MVPEVCPGGQLTDNAMLTVCGLQRVVDGCMNRGLIYERIDEWNGWPSDAG